MAPRPTSAPRLQSLAGTTRNAVVHVTELDLRTSRYQQLPPIRKKHEKKTTTPVPPEGPVRLYVGIQAEVVAEAAAKTPIVDTTMVPYPRVLEGDERRLWRGEEEEGVVSDVLARLVHDVVFAGDFQEALENIAGEPVPRFAQIAVEAQAAPASGKADLAADLAGDGLFRKLAERVLEETLANIIGEGEEGVFDICKVERRTV